MRRLQVGRGGLGVRSVLSLVGRRLLMLLMVRIAGGIGSGLLVMCLRLRLSGIWWLVRRCVIRRIAVQSSNATHN